MTEEQIRSTIQLGCRVLLKGTLVEHTVNEFSDEHIRLVELFPRYRYSEIKTILSWPIPKELNASHVNHWVRIKTAEENPNPHDHTKEMAHLYGKWAKIKEIRGYSGQSFEVYEESRYKYYLQDIAEYRPIEPVIYFTTRRLIDIPIGTFVRIKGKEADKWHKVVETRDNHPVIISPGGSRTMITLPLEVLETISSLDEIPDGFIMRQYNYSEWYTKEQFLGRSNLCFADIVEITPVFKSQPVPANNIPCSEIILGGPQPCVLGYDKNKKQEDKLMLDTLDQIKEAELTPELLEKAAQETKRVRDDKAAQQVQAKQQALLNELDHHLEIKKNNDAAIVRVNALLAALGYPPKGK